MNKPSLTLQPFCTHSILTAPNLAYRHIQPRVGEHLSYETIMRIPWIRPVEPNKHTWIPDEPAPKVPGGLNGYQDVESNLLAWACCAIHIRRYGHHFSPVRHAQACQEVDCPRPRLLLARVRSCFISNGSLEKLMVNTRKFRSEWSMLPSAVTQWIASRSSRNFSIIVTHYCHVQNASNGNVSLQ